MAKPYSWSFSKIGVFETCPHKFYRLHIIKDIADEGNYATSRGGMIHKGLEDYAVSGGEKMPHKDLYIESYLPTLDKLLALPSSRILVEEKMAVSRTFEPIGDYFDWRVRGRAISDLSLEFKDLGHAVLIDYKTGKDYAPKFMAQGKVVAFMKMLKTPWIQSVDVRFHNLDTDNYQFKWKYKREDIPELIIPIQHHVDQVEETIKAKNFTKRPNGLCKQFCPVKDCQFNGG